MADMIIGKVKALFTGDATGLVDATRKSEKALKNLGDTAEQTAKETSTAMKNMAGNIATAFATAKLVQFARQSVMAAADVNEALNATRVIFGDSAKAIEAFAATASTSLGQSRKQALDAANTFATFGKSAGLAGNDLTKFSLDMVRLASDLASFRNTTPEDAIMAIGAALRGESEPIRRYGILLNDAVLSQEALAMGLINTTKGALQPSVKVLAAQAAILKQSTDAQGDFARTSTSLSNQVKISNAQIADMKANIGTALVPVMQGALQPLNALAGAFNKLDSGTQKTIGQLAMFEATLLLAARALRGFGVAAATVTKGMVALNAAFITVMAVGKIFAAGTESNTAETQGFTQALKENDAALRNNALQELAAQDPQVREYLNTIGQLGITIGDLKQYYDGLTGPAAGVRDQLAQIANTAFTAVDRIALLNKQYGLNINVSALTEEKAEALWSQFQNLQFLLFNVEQQWRNNTLGTDALASALGQLSTEAEGTNTVIAETAESFDKYREAVLGASYATDRDFRLGLNKAANEVLDFVSGLKDGAMSSFEFENALIGQADKLLELQYAAKGSADRLRQVTPTARALVESMYALGKAQGYTVAETRGLINELGLLDGVDPQIMIYMSMDIEQLRAQAQAIRAQIESLRMDSFSRNSPMMRDMLDQLEMIGNIADAVNQVGDFKPSGGGGGGGGEKPFAWVEDWMKDLAQFTKDLMRKDFADRLVEMSADDIAQALADLVDTAMEKGISLLDGGKAVELIKKVSSQLQAAANQLGGEDGLEARFAKATEKVRQFQAAYDDLSNRFKEFQRLELGIGSPSTLQRLDEEIAKLDDLKGRVAAAEEAYRAFKDEGVSALDAQLQRLEQLRGNLDRLRAGYDELNASVAGDAALSPLDRERKQLDALRSALDNASRARADYAQSVATQSAQIQYADRGGALSTAQKWLAKASAFRDVIAGLRDRAFPLAIIRDVLNAGVEGGTKLGRKLLALSDTDLAELKKVQQQISAVAAETGEIAASVLFDADVSAADSAFRQQLSLVRGLYQQAISQSQAQFNQQQAIVEGVYQQQIASAKVALEQQRTLVQALFQSALAEAKDQLNRASDDARILKTALDDLRGAMRDLITSIVNAVQQAQQQQQQPPAASGGGGPSGGGGSSFIPSTGMERALGTGLGDFVRMPGQDWQFVHRTPVGDYIQQPDGSFVGIDLRANGGPVLSHTPYVVGERGPELFVPNRGGNIISNEDLVTMGAGRGPATYNITVNARGDASEVGRQVVRAIQEYERRNGTAWRS